MNEIQEKNITLQVGTRAGNSYSILSMNDDTNNELLNRQNYTTPSFCWNLNAIDHHIKKHKFNSYYYLIWKSFKYKNNFYRIKLQYLVPIDREVPYRMGKLSFIWQNRVTWGNRWKIPEVVYWQSKLRISDGY